MIDFVSFYRMYTFQIHTFAVSLRVHRCFRNSNNTIKCKRTYKLYNSFDKLLAKVEDKFAFARTVASLHRVQTVRR